MENTTTGIGSRKLALFLDGTWNTSVSNTNVWRLKSLCDQNEHQRVYYSRGVGTNKGEHLLGGGFGLGIDAEITDAYEWLIENFNMTISYLFLALAVARSPQEVLPD